MAEKVIGGPINAAVRSQLAVRSKIMSKGERTNEDLMYLTSKTGWAKLSSGVNVKGSNKLAKQYVLIAGQKGKHGSNSYSNYTDVMGFRPMPGITGVEVRSINRFGVLKEATITFNCWSVQQLTDLEMLYMRPGFTLLLEWGHSIYSKDGKVPYDHKVETFPDFFDKKDLSKKTVYAEIERLKTQSHYNYDAILGFCKNFTWSFRADGGYDCTTTVISIGEIVESLQVLLDSASHNPSSPTAGGTTTGTTKDEDAQATVLQGVLTFIKSWATKDAWEQTKLKYPDFAKHYEERNGITGYEMSQVGTVTIVDGKDKTNSNFVYIPFSTFCKIINGLTIVDQTNEPLARINTSHTLTSEINTFKFHESIDPSTCLIVSPNASYLYTYAPDLYDILKSGITEGSTTDALNILLNIDMLLSIMEEMLQKPVEDRSLFDIFDTIFAKVNSALGGINELALHYDEATSTYYVVDRQIQVEKSDLHVLNITGLKSTVTKFDFTTKLSPALTTMIAISAQGGGSDVGVDASALLRWNEGLSDRIMTTKGQDKDPTNTETAADRIKNQQQQRLTVYESFLSAFYKSKQFDLQKLDEAKANYSQYAKTYKNNYDESAGKAGPAGIVPFEVGIEMDGISGLKIGEAFIINEAIMPDKYNGVIGFIITGLSHKITGNKWTTILKAQTITLSGGLSKKQSSGNRERVNNGFTPTGDAPATNFIATTSDAKTAAEKYLGRAMTDTEWSQLVAATFAEAGHSQIERAYIMGVMLNRVRSGKWGGTVTSVLTAKSQFQSVTGTKANGHAPSANYRNGPNGANRESIYGAATNFLQQVPKNYIYFTSNITAAYGKGTNIGFRDQLRKSGTIIGDSVFSA